MTKKEKELQMERETLQMFARVNAKAKEIKDIQEADEERMTLGKWWMYFCTMTMTIGLFIGAVGLLLSLVDIIFA